MSKVKEYKQPRYMIGTTAIHQLGDISREDGDLCMIHSYTDTDYIGNWVTGFGFIDVKFPRKDTRELNEEDIKKWDGKVIGISGSWHYTINIKKKRSNDV
jgi:hypothetical protein